MAFLRLGPALCLTAILLSPTASLCQSVTTTGSRAALCQFAWYHFHEDAETFRDAANDHHFALLSDDELIIEQPYSGTAPPPGEPSIFDFQNLLLRHPDLLLLSSDGDSAQGDQQPACVLVEPYVNRDCRDLRLDFLRDAGFTPQQVVPVIDHSNPPRYGIAATPGFCGFFYNYDVQDDRSIVFAAFCFGGRWLDTWNAGAAVGHTGQPYDWLVKAAIDTFFTRMNGERGRTKRTTGEAYQGTGFIIQGSQYQNDIVLSPAVQAVHPDSGYTFASLQYYDAWIDFDTEIEIVGPANEALGVGTFVDSQGVTRPCAYIQNVQLVNGDTRISYQIMPNYRGDFPVWVNWNNVKGKGSQDRYLNGNTDPPGSGPYATGINCRPPDRDDYVIPYSSTVGDNPAASVHGFAVVDGALRWKVESDYHTDHYQVETAPAPEGPWEALGPPLPPGPGHRALDLLDLTDSTYRWYRLVETETSGRQILHAVAAPHAKSDAPPLDPPTAESLRERIARLNRERSEGDDYRADPTLGSADTLVAYCPAALASDVQYAITDFWQNWWGYHTDIVTIDGFPSDPDSFRAYLKADIAARAAAGARYFLLVGDANDWLWFDLDQEGDQYWVGDWLDIHDQYIASGYPPQGQPENDVIPTFVVPDTLPRDRNVGWFTPYWMTDMPYQDVDDDGVPDVVLARLPFNDAESVLAFGYKMQDNQVGWYGAESVSFFVGDRDHYGVGDGQRALDAAQAVEAELPPGLSVHHLYESDVPDDAARNDAAAAHWNTYYPELLVMLASRSNRSWPANFFDQTDGSNPWHMGMIDSYGTQGALVIGASCDAGDFARTEDPDYGTPIAHKFLAADDRGALAWVGPSVGSWQDGNAVLARYLVQELYNDPERPSAESFLIAVQRVLEDYADEPDVTETVRSYMFLGDPLSRVNQMQVSVGVESPLGDQPRFALLQSSPNPFTPSTRIAFTTTCLGPVELSIYNLKGQRVRTLVNTVLPPGRHEAYWHGDDDQGRHLATGVYFCRLSAEEGTADRKILFLK